MSLDLHDALTDMAAEGGDPRQAPTTRLVNLVHRRRAAHTAATSAVGVAAVGAVAFGVVAVLDHSGPTTGPGPATENTAAAPDGTTQGDSADDQAADAIVPVWDLVPDSALDVAAAPERAVTEALAALPVGTEEGPVLYLLDAADTTWVRSPWPAAGSGNQQVQALSPDGRTIAHTTHDGERSQMQLIELATGAVTEVAPLLVDGQEFWATLADFAPGGGSLAILGVGDPEAGPVAVFDVDLASGDVRVLASFDDVNLASAAGLAYSPDGSRLAVSAVGVEEPYRDMTAVLDADGTVLQQWAAATQAGPWYGNDALRASALESTDVGEWKGYLVVGTGEAVGEIRSYDEQPWNYGTPPEPPLGVTHGQYVQATGDPAASFRITDAAAGTVRSWLQVTNAGEFFDGWNLLHRAR